MLLDERDLEWHDLWGRSLQLIDAQNLFCEVDRLDQIQAQRIWLRKDRVY